MRNRRIFLLIIGFGIIPFLVGGQTESNSFSPPETSIKIEDCNRWARENYPLVKRLELVQKTAEYNLNNASKGNFPQITLNGQATYQSDVTGLPFEMSGIDRLSKDQYKFYGEVYQPLTQFGKVETKKNQIQIDSEIEKQKIEVDLYQLNNRINGLYFGILLLRESIVQLNLTEMVIDAAVARIQAGVENGINTTMDLNLLEVEKATLDQKIAEKSEDVKAYLFMLTQLTGHTIDINTVLVKPEVLTVSASSHFTRPELNLFELQNQSLNIQEQRLKKSLGPNLGLFAQGGYGRPALNFLSNDFDFYYIAGIKFHWNVSEFYRYKNAKETLNLSRQSVDLQRETFMLNMNITSHQQESEILKWDAMIERDSEILQLREQVLTTAKFQLENGIITTADFIRFVNQAEQSRQNLLFHQTQKLLAQYNLLTTVGSPIN